MSLVGYARVSATETRRHLDRQVDALRVSGCECVFEDRAAGHDADRPQLARCLARLRPGDVLVVTDLDRIGMLAAELVALIADLDARGIAFKAVDAPVDTATPSGRAFLRIHAAFAEMQHRVIRQRILGMSRSARARVANGEGRRVMTVDKLRRARHLLAERSRSIADICRREFAGMPSSTLYRYLRADGRLKDPGRRLLEAQADEAAAD